MTTTSSIIGFDSTSLLNYYSAQLSTSAARATSSSSSSSSTKSTSTNASSSTDDDTTPWSEKQLSQEARDADVLSTTSFIDLTDVPVSATSDDKKIEQDNQKLYALYRALDKLTYLTSMAKRDGVTDGQREGYNTRFQAGMAEVEKFIADNGFNNFALQAEEPASSVTSTATVPTATFNYTGSTLVDGNNIDKALSGLSSSDSFTITVSKGGVSQDVAIDLSQVSGDLTVGNVVSYVNQQLGAAGYSTRFKKVLVSGDIDAATTATKALQRYAIEVDPGGTEQVSLSSSSSPSLYVTGTSGLTSSVTTTDSLTGKVTTTDQDNQGRLIKLSDLSASSDPSAVFSRTMSPATGNTTATSTLVDGDGNVYMLGNATGDIGTQYNQGDQDVYLTKYDTAGNLIWSKLVGSAGTAEGAAMALNPNGGVTIVGSTTAQLSTTAVANGNQDSFVAQYDDDGNQKWVTQIQTLNTNEANAVTVDDSGNVYIGGQTQGVIGAGQTKIGGTDAYVIKLDSKGTTVYQQQFGTTGDDSVAATALTDSGDLVVASVQNGHAILTKYAGGDATTTPTWTMDMGDLQGGSIGSIALSGDQVYVSGTTTNSALNATVTNAASGGKDAFVFAATDNGSSITAGHVSYVGTSTTDSAGALTVDDSTGTVYLAGTTAGTFAGENRSVSGTTNMFVASLTADGSVNWVNQYGGMDGQSTGTGIAFTSGGSSVLDALGLPSGSVGGQQTSYLASSTTLRAGDNFSVAIEGDAERTFKITIDKDETLSSLVTKLNSQLGSKGEAKVTYTSKGAALKITMSTGVTAKLISGDDNFDALARLGISAQTLSNEDDSISSSSSSTDTYALGLASNLDISTSTAAGAARAQLLSVLSKVQKVYQTTNTVTSTTSTGHTSSKTQALSTIASTYTNNLTGGLSTALSLLTTA